MFVPPWTLGMVGVALTLAFIRSILGLATEYSADPGSSALDLLICAIVLACIVGTVYLITRERERK
jgi:hypothetical protein